MLVYHESLDRIKKRYAECGDPEGLTSIVKTYASTPATPMQINLFENKAFIILYGEEPTVIKFEQSEIHDGFKKYFEELWNQDITTSIGRDNVEIAYNDIISLAKKDEEVVIFAAKPKDSTSAKFNVEWAQRLSEKCKKIKYIYYGNIPENIARAKEIETQVKNSEVKIISTNQSLPISNVIIGDTTLNTIWSEEPVCLVTKNKTVTDSLKENFKLLWNQETQILHGTEVVKNIWLESLETGKLKFIGAKGYFVDRYPEMFKEILTKAKKIPNLKWQNIVDSSAKTHKLNSLPWMEARYNLKGNKNPNVVWLWGDKVALANWNEVEPVVMISTNKTMVQSYHDYFDELWNQKV